TRLRSVTPLFIPPPREAAAFGGWPATGATRLRSVTPLFIPPAREAAAFGGWPATGATRLRSVTPLFIPPPREAAAFGGWPATGATRLRSVTPLFIPPTECRGLTGGWNEERHSVGGLRQVRPGCVPSRRSSYHRPARPRALVGRLDELEVGARDPRPGATRVELEVALPVSDRLRAALDPHQRAGEVKVGVGVVGRDLK